MFNRLDKNFLKVWDRDIYKDILHLSIFFLFIGCFFSFTASPVVATRIGLNNYNFMLKHCFFALFSCFIIFFVSFFNEKQVINYSVVCFIILFMLLIAVYFFGNINKGAKRWIYINGFSLQPSEILKPFFVVITSFLFAKSKKKEYYYIYAIFIFIMVFVFLIKQPDLGLAILITATFLAEIFLTNINLKYFTISITIFLLSSIIIFYLLFPHFAHRINVFINSAFYDNNKSFQITKSLNAFNNGEFFGKGILEGSIKNNIPDAHTDFIFSVIAEEMGAITCIFILSLYVFFTLKVILITFETESNFKYLSVMGLSFMFLFQALINIGVSINLLPTKGMTLPLISYGGSSMLGTAVSIGFILALTKKSYGNIQKNIILLER
ncbi:MAG: putative lipid II flippase FtsW [Rickettsiales bacterium]|nr:MAG: putative lipid II flippase FtsW [Rickettsiales bacterium]